MTIRTIRARLGRILARERAAWLEHRREYDGSCTSNCGFAQRWWTARDLLGQALRAAGARVPRWAAPDCEEPEDRRGRPRAPRGDAASPPPLDRAPTSIVAGSEGA